MNNIDIGSYIEYPLEKGKEMFKDIKDNVILQCKKGLAC